MQIMNLTLGQICGGIAGIIIVLSVFVEITPVKINPVSKFLAWLGKKTNQELFDKFDSFEKKVDRLEEQAAINCRVRILQFGDELRRNVKHSQESFNQVLSDIDAYERYCAEHHEFANNKTVRAKERILSVYDACLEQNDFL